MVTLSMEVQEEAYEPFGYSEIATVITDLDQSLVFCASFAVAVPERHLGSQATRICILAFGHYERDPDLDCTVVD